MTQQYSSKDPREIETFTLDFKHWLADSETIIGQTTAIEVLSGTDPAVGTMLNGVPLVSGSQVLQSIQNGVDGTVYKYTVEITTSGGQTLVGVAHLLVRTKK